jgi:hypothetical protein
MTFTGPQSISTSHTVMNISLPLFQFIGYNAAIQSMHRSRMCVPFAPMLRGSMIRLLTEKSVELSEKSAHSSRVCYTSSQNFPPLPPTPTCSS